MLEERFEEVTGAIRVASGLKGHCVGWDQACTEWVVYSPTDGAPVGVQPEMLCLDAAHIPIPLTAEAVMVLRSLLESRTANWTSGKSDLAATSIEEPIGLAR